MTALTREVRHLTERGKPDRTVFVLAGPEGATTLEIFGDPPMGGPVGIHTPNPAGGPCEFVPGGRCDAAEAFRAGAEASERYLAGHGESAVFAELEGWYRSRLAPGTEG